MLREARVLLALLLAFLPGVPALAQSGTCGGDTNGDGVVNAADLAILLGNWGTPGAGDIDGSGTVGAPDLALMLGAWG